MSIMSDYRIRTVAQMTGMSPVLLRAWESRYGLVRPERTKTGYRLYSEEDVAVFLGAQRLVRQGMAPMQVAQLPRSRLLEGTRRAQLPWSSPAEPLPGGNYQEIVERFLRAIARFDSERAHEVLALPLSLLAPEVACRNFLAPLLIELGERWHRRELTIAVEHFGTTLVRNKLIVILDALRARGLTQRVLCAGPPGEQHDLGLLMFAVDAASQGFEPIYLGANLPLAELEYAARETKPTLAATSIVLARDVRELRRLLAEMKAAVGVSCPLLVGGRGIVGYEAIVHESRCVTMPSSEMLVDLLSAATPNGRKTLRGKSGRRPGRPLRRST